MTFDKRQNITTGDRIFVRMGGRLVPGVVDAVLPPYVAVLIEGEPVPYLLNARSVISE